MFHYKFINGTISTKEKLHALKLIDCLLCTSCKVEVKCFGRKFCLGFHLFKGFKLCIIMIYVKELQEFSVLDILFSIFNTSKEFVVVNQIILPAKFYSFLIRL